MTTSARCPCGSGEVYADCCGPAHDGSRIPATAEALMRSRFSAFAVGDGDYLRSSWHPTTRPERIVLDPEIDWTRLQILETLDGGQFDTHGIVAFRAHNRIGNKRGVLAERSTFVKVDGRWFYLTGEAGD